MNNPEIDKNGNKWWVNDEEDLHREDGPAIEWNGTKFWYINGKCHREDGPAVERYNGEKVWYYNNEFIGCSEEGFAQEDFDKYLRSLKIKEYW